LVNVDLDRGCVGHFPAHLRVGEGFLLQLPAWLRDAIVKVSEDDGIIGKRLLLGARKVAVPLHRFGVRILGSCRHRSDQEN